MKNYSVSFDSMLIFKFKLPYGSLLGVSYWRLLPARGPGGAGRVVGPPCGPQILPLQGYVLWEPAPCHSEKVLPSCLSCLWVCPDF